MPRNPLKLKIGYLYPDILQGFCDDANVETFAQRAKWRGVDASIHQVCANDKITASKYDFYYIGGQNPYALNMLAPYIKINADELRTASLSYIPILAVNAGYQILGNSFQLPNCALQKGLGILNVNSAPNKKIIRGSVIGSCNFLRNKTIAGYEDHRMVTLLDKETVPFLTLQTGSGNNGKDKTEGAKIYNTIGTYLSGPILAQNPHLCDFLIAMTLRVKYKCKVPLTKLKDDIEWYSHRYILEMK